MDVQLVKTGMELVVFHVQLPKTGTLLPDPVDVLPVQIGMEIAVLVALVEEFGMPLQIHAFVHQEIGMDSRVYLVPLAKLGVQLPYHAHVQPIHFGMD